MFGMTCMGPMWYPAGIRTLLWQWGAENSDNVVSGAGDGLLPAHFTAAMTHTQAVSNMPAISAGTCDGLIATQSIATGDVDYAYVKEVNAVASSLSASMPAGQTYAEDLANTVSFAASDQVAIGMTRTNSTTAWNFHVRVTSRVVLSGSSVLFWCWFYRDGQNTTSDRFPLPTNTGVAAMPSLESDSQVLAIAGGSIDGIFVQQSAAFGGADEAMVARVNGVSTSVSVTLTAGSTTASSTANTASYSAGDRVTIKANQSSASAVTVNGKVALRTTDQPAFAFGHAIGQNTLADRWVHYATYSTSTPSTARDQARMLSADDTTFSKLRGFYNASSATNHTYTLEVNSVTTAITMSISSGGTSGSDTSHTASAARGDSLNLLSQQAAATGGTMRARFSIA